MSDSSNRQKENWYAVYTRPRSEKKVYELLTQNNFKSYLPLVTTIRQWSDRKKKVQVPLISSYVFVKMEEKNLNSILPVNGIVRILKHLGKPAIIRDYEIDNMKILLEDSDKINLMNQNHFKKGDAVIVENGLFKGLIAECVKFNGKYRIIARIEALGNIIEVNIPISQVKKI